MRASPSSPLLIFIPFKTTLYFLCLLLSAPIYAREVGTCEKVSKLLYLVNKVHYQPPVFDKAFSERVVESYLYSIDPQCLYLYNNDIEALKQIQNSEGNFQEILCKSYNFLTSIYEKRLRQTDSLLSTFADRKHTWQQKDTLFINRSFKDAYPKNINKKIDALDNWLKLYMLHELEISEKLERDSAFDKNSDLKLKAINKLRKGIRKIIAIPANINYMLEEDLLQAIAFECDPHSSYFTPKEKADFNEMLSPSVEAYGFNTAENESGQIEITSIKPGSPAWKCNNLNTGDLIKEIKFKNKATLDITEYDEYEFNEMMQRAEEKEMDITVFKKSGATVITHLAKEVLRSDENVINSYVLQKTKLIGYIPLPSFYTDFSGYTASGCANDVAKEIVKLKAENIEGLILDLRNNGGGSVEEALNLAGIFIDAAPLCIEKYRTEKPFVLKDMNRGTIYDGPLLVLINIGSASASELVTKMLREQQRAIVVGSNSYGKASGQIIIPLDTSYSLTGIRRMYDDKNGFIKITAGKFYDLSGVTHQKTGIVPDIKLPDPWFKIPVGEKEYSNALANDVIDKKVKLDIHPDDKIFACIEQSNKRVSNNDIYKQVEKVADELKVSYEKRFVISLTPQSYYKMIQYYSNLDSISKNVMSFEDDSFQVNPNKETGDIMRMDEFLAPIIKDQMDGLKKDIILQESYNILIDYNSN